MYTDCVRTLVDYVIISLALTDNYSQILQDNRKHHVCKFVKDNKRFLTRRILALLTYLMYKAKDKEYNGNIKIKDHYRVF